MDAEARQLREDEDELRRDEPLCPSHQDPRAHSWSLPLCPLRRKDRRRHGHEHAVQGHGEVATHGAGAVHGHGDTLDKRQLLR